MTPFNPEGKAELTHGDTLEPAMAITEADDALQYFASYAAYIRLHMDSDTDESGRSAEDLARINLGYYAGYYGAETKQRVERLFQCSHPVFGKIQDRGQPSAEEAFAAGAALMAGDPQ